MLPSTMIVWAQVGFGDFAPKTMLSRLLTMICVIAGVVFFSIQTGEVVRIFALEKEGQVTECAYTSLSHQTPGIFCFLEGQTSFNHMWRGC